ncbi:MAG TPA: ornithine carbamoyltransferase [Phycisphaerae bacterium]|nr:ornithine carbamoyltransferase [Phycisphaerae bacterium]
MKTDIPASLSGMEHFLAIRDLDPTALADLIDFCIRRKKQFLDGNLKPMLQGKVLAMIFQKASLRTRLGFEAAMVQLGGHAIHLEDHQVGLTKREDVRDVARVISSMCDAIMARVFGHQLVIELARFSRVPVINGLSDFSHPCQALSDLTTIQEKLGRLAGLKVAYIGDANNVARSLRNGCVMMGVHFAIAAPRDYQFSKGDLETAHLLAGKSGASLTQTAAPAEAADGADVLYTDVWTSMGQENESRQREKTFADYQLNAGLLRRAKPTALVMHCLPAHRNMEITDEVIDGPQSVIFDQAENRLHCQRALLELLME